MPSSAHVLWLVFRQAAWQMHQRCHLYAVVLSHLALLLEYEAPACGRVYPQGRIHKYDDASVVAEGTRLVQP